MIKYGKYIVVRPVVNDVTYCDLSTWKAEQTQRKEAYKFLANLGYMSRLCLNRRKRLIKISKIYMSLKASTFKKDRWISLEIGVPGQYYLHNEFKSASADLKDKNLSQK